MPACRPASSPSSPDRRRSSLPELIASPVIRKVSLTGSVAVGKKVLAQCAEGIKRGLDGARRPCAGDRPSRCRPEGRAPRPRPWPSSAIPARSASRRPRFYRPREHQGAVRGGLRRVRPEHRRRRWPQGRRHHGADDPRQRRRRRAGAGRGRGRQGRPPAPWRPAPGASQQGPFPRADGDRRRAATMPASWSRSRSRRSRRSPPSPTRTR